jgi:hypothetical protein
MAKLGTARPRFQRVDEALAHLSPVTSQVQGLIDFVGSHPHFALMAVFLLALSEAVPVVGTVVPGSTAILGISALATTAQLDPWLLLIAATAQLDPWLLLIAATAVSFAGARAERLFSSLSPWPSEEWVCVAPAESEVPRPGRSRRSNPCVCWRCARTAPTGFSRRGRSCSLPQGEGPMIRPALSRTSA